MAIHRIQFAFTAGYHYIFPQLTMGLALLIVVFKWRELRGDAASGLAARFWLRIFGVTFLFGVVTGIPLEFQFGTNWARFSAATGSVIGQTLAMEGIFAFFLEASFLYLLLHGQNRLSPRLHFLVAILLLVGTWLSAYFIVCTNAWMQHPTGASVAEDGTIRIDGLAALLGNEWALWQFAHAIAGAVTTAAFVVCSIGALHLLQGRHVDVARRMVQVGAAAALGATIAITVTGDSQARAVYEHQPVTFAAMEGHFHSENQAGLVIIGQPDVERMRLDNPVVIPRALSFMTHNRFTGHVTGLADFNRTLWPDDVALVYYSYHVMVGLGTLFLLVAGLAAWFSWRGTLVRKRWMLWVLLLLLPLPYVANTAGWMTAELGRQPWIVHGLMRTVAGGSENVSRGNGMFTLLGFLGLYAMMSALYLTLVGRIILAGPEPAGAPVPEET